VYSTWKPQLRPIIPWICRGKSGIVAASAGYRREPPDRPPDPEFPREIAESAAGLDDLSNDPEDCFASPGSRGGFRDRLRELQIGHGINLA